ncbi:MAG: 16S rRNA (cytidine(1402)-2'-O)-methyltransferase, partial [Peptococcaceae bacterium]|nr:16S rRNA (cytidine(1402)-2'-O)-methyltransferase [Peptococcaceae bacterium]
MSDKGILYLCATPIGNLEDITLRALRVLKEVNLVAAEDTRRTRKLFSHYDIHTPLTSYHDHNSSGKGQYLISQLLEGKNLALVTDAGLPGISDPGEEITLLALASGIRVVPIPGPSASLSALIV